MVEHFKRGTPLIAFSLLPHEQKVSYCLVGNGSYGTFQPVLSDSLMFYVADVLLLGM